MKLKIRKRRRDSIVQRYWIKVAQPKTVKTMPKDGVIAEPKYDGSRMLLIVEGNKPYFINRRKVLKNDIYPDLLSIPKNISGDVVLDGEVVAIDSTHQYGNFDKLAERDRLQDKEKINDKSKKIPLTYVAFDILKKGNEDVSQKPLLERKKILDNVVKQGKIIKEIEYTNNPELMLKKVKKAKGEGIVIKDTQSPYTKGHSRAYQKLKLVKENDVAIVGYTPGTGKRKKYFGALKMAVNTPKGFKEVGTVGTGLKDSDLKEITPIVKKGKQFVARVKYRKIGSQGNYIEPAFISKREDITPKQTHP